MVCSSVPSQTWPMSSDPPSGAKPLLTQNRDLTLLKHLAAAPSPGMPMTA